MVQSSLRDFTDHSGDLDTTVGCCLLQQKNDHFLKNLATCHIHIGQGNAQSNVEISFRQSQC